MLTSNGIFIGHILVLDEFALDVNLDVVRLDTLQMTTQQQ
jgi:hypothetical protein